MLTIFHAPRSRSARVVWLCEEMGVPYRIEPASVFEPSAAFVKANPLRSAPAAIDGDTCMTESIAIMLYIMGRHGPTDLALGPDEPAYGTYLQFLIFGEAGLGMNANPIIAARFLAPEAEKMNWSVRNCTERFVQRMQYVDQQLGDKPYIAGERFTAADISVGHSIGLAGFVGVGDKVSPRLSEYCKRLAERPAYQRAMARQ
jgi:glutathione S-transferase/3-isopropylmalate dehydratase